MPKINGYVQHLIEPNCLLTIDEQKLKMFGIEEGSTLTGVLLEKENLYSDEILKPKFSIIFSPFLTSSWNRMIRVLITVDPVPGSLQLVQKCLNHLGLFSRHIESVNGIDLKIFSIKDSKEFRENKRESEYIIPSSLIYIELPNKDVFLDDYKKKDREDRLIEYDKMKELHDSMDQMIQSKGVEKDVCKKNIEKCLNLVYQRMQKKKEENNSKRIEVDWVSPLKTLNTLGELMSLSSKEEESINKHRLNVCKKVTVENGNQVSLKHWELDIWNQQHVIPDSVKYQLPKHYLVVGHADVSEQVYIWDFFAQEKILILEFSLLTPSNDLEHMWWGYVFDCLDEAKANILSVKSSSKRTSNWSDIKIIASFNFDHDKEEEVISLLNCMRSLQGDEHDTDPFIVFQKKLESENQSISQYIERKNSEGSYPRKISTLKIEKIWDPSVKEKRTYRKVFRKNPFSFTKSAYSNVENIEQKNKINLLAESIADRLINGENISIVGAHRSGKTSILNLVKGYLDIPESRNKTGQRDIIVVQLNCSILSPLEIFPEIYFKILENDINETVKNKIRSAIKFMKNAIVNVAKTEIKSLSLSGARFSTKSDKGQTVSKDIRQDIKELAWFQGDVKAQQFQIIIKNCFNQLNDILKEINGTNLIVIMDEIGGLIEWGREVFVPAWRFVIESEDYSRINWLITNAKPIQESLSYSPISNSFREYNVRPLSNDDATSLLNKFDKIEHSLDGKSLPVITFEAKMFILDTTGRLPYFMQVTLYHLYNHVTQHSIPIANRNSTVYILKKRVLPEVSDYISSQWQKIEKDIREFVMKKIAELEEKVMFDNWEFNKLDVPNIPSKVIVSLNRSGLRSNDNKLVIPIVFLWIKQNLI